MISLREKAMAVALGVMASMLPAVVSAKGPNATAPLEKERRAPGDAGGPAVRVAQVAETDLLVRLERLDDQMRQLTGAVEQLQYRNQQLEQQLRRLQESPDPRGAPRPGPMGSSAPPTGPGATAGPGPGDRYPGDRYQPPAAGGGEPYSPPPPPAPGQRRAEVFDPTQNPNAPGAPRPLGQLPPGRSEEAMVGAPGGRAAGAPLDLSTLSDTPANGGAYGGPGAPLPAPPSRNPSATGGERLVMAPSSSPKDEYDLAYGYVLRKDYVLAEESFRSFLKTYPNDRLVPEAHYWLGESLFQRQRYRDAAEAFLTISTRYETAPKAPEAMVRLGQSLAALGERDAACGTLGEIGRKYPRAGVNVKQMVEREQKRAGC